MQQVPLRAVANQTIAFNADGAYWQLHIYQAVDSMCADITLNGTMIMSGVRCLSGTGLMPYSYMYEPNYGNFVFDSDGDWTEFGANCNLYYLSNSEYSQFQSYLINGVPA